MHLRGQKDEEAYMWKARRSFEDGRTVMDNKT